MCKNKDTRITIGITAFKGIYYIRSAIESVLTQLNADWEGILILDGGADKKTVQFFNEFNHPKFQKYCFKTNRGPYGTRSKAIELCKTEWYYQLDGDDLLPNNAIKYILDTIKRNPDAEFIYGNCEYFTDTNSQIKYPTKDIEALAIGPLFNAQSPIKKTLFKKIGGFCNEFYINADWDFWLYVHEKKIRGAYVNNIIYKRRQRVKGIGNEKIYLRPLIVEKIIKRHPLFFNSLERKNRTLFNVNEKLARYYKAIGHRKNASKYAREALKYGNSVNAFNTIFAEERMSSFRYLLRRIGRAI
mgnify:CR=1 FL=1